MTCTSCIYYTDKEHPYIGYPCCYHKGNDPNVVCIYYRPKGGEYEDQDK